MADTLIACRCTVPSLSRKQVCPSLRWTYNWELLTHFNIEMDTSCVCFESSNIHLTAGRTSPHVPWTAAEWLVWC